MDDTVKPSPSRQKNKSWPRKTCTSVSRLLHAGPLASRIATLLRRMTPAGGQALLEKGLAITTCYECSQWVDSYLRAGRLHHELA